MRWRLIVHHLDGSLTLSTVFEGQANSPVVIDVADHVTELQAIIDSAQTLLDHTAPSHPGWIRLNAAMERVRIV